MTIMAALTAPLKSLLSKTREKEDQEDEQSSLRKSRVSAAQSHADVSIASAEAVLYQHLSEQITAYREIADRAMTERNQMVDRIARLEAASDAFAEAKVTMSRMAKRLEDQDAQITKLLADFTEERKTLLAILQDKDGAIAQRDQRILALETRQSELERRLHSDEAILGCPFHNIKETPPTPST
jgi:chromosome segregation ATPase